MRAAPANLVALWLTLQSAASARRAANKYGKPRRFSPAPMILDIKPASSGFVVLPQGNDRRCTVKVTLR